MRKHIFLDFASTTPLDPDVKKEMDQIESHIFGNASSIHAFGSEARAIVDTSRDMLADVLDCKQSEIIFTSGATESNNLALQGISHANHQVSGCFRHNKIRLDHSGLKNHIITTSIEHPSVLRTCYALEKWGINVSYVKPNKKGIVDPKDVEKYINERTILISVMYVNNEIGTIQPIKKIGKIARKYHIPFHVDAVQAINYLDCRADFLHADLISLSSHKMYGPKGVGALFVRKGVTLSPVFYGGDQEYELRPGTSNVPAIAGFGIAAQQVQENCADITKRVQNLRDHLISQLCKSIPDIRINGSLHHRVPNNINIFINNVEGESLVVKLDMAGFAVSTGSACAAGSIEPSNVLQEIGLSKKQASSSLRITIGKYTTMKQLDHFCNAITRIVNELRSYSSVIHTVQV